MLLQVNTYCEKMSSSLKCSKIHSTTVMPTFKVSQLFLNSPLNTQINKVKEVAKDLTSLALYKCLKSVEMKACPEHKAFSTSQERK